jgi:hypothetical protein
MNIYWTAFKSCFCFKYSRSFCFSSIFYCHIAGLALLSHYASIWLSKPWVAIFVLHVPFVTLNLLSILIFDGDSFGALSNKNYIAYLVLRGPYKTSLVSSSITVEKRAMLEPLVENLAGSVSSSFVYDPLRLDINSTLISLSIND